ncbi:MAG: hypothetical protein M3P26_16315 [Gemmatimonadota bacterium]|nr:hypothetical protein [Gemmatimonadota bacterium]
MGLRELARKCGLSAAYLSDIERCNRHASPRVESVYEELL